MQTNLMQTNLKNPDRRAGLAPPRFGLRAFLAMVAVACCVMATFSAAGPIVGWVVVLALLVVAAHVAGNVLGTQLRANGSQPLPMNETEIESFHASLLPVPQPRVHRLSTEHFAPATRLSQRRPLGRFMAVMTTCGAIGGAVIAWVLLANYYAAIATVSIFAVASVSAGVLGGLFAFALFSLLQVLLGAVWQAHCHSHEQSRAR
jgi:hypothetical protein